MRRPLLVFVVMLVVAYASFFAGYVAGREHTKYQLRSAFADGGQVLRGELNKIFWKGFTEESPKK